MRSIDVPFVHANPDEHRTAEQAGDEERARKHEHEHGDEGDEDDVHEFIVRRVLGGVHNSFQMITEEHEHRDDQHADNGEVPFDRVDLILHHFQLVEHVLHGVVRRLFLECRHINSFQKEHRHIPHQPHRHQQDVELFAKFDSQALHLGFETELQDHGFGLQLRPQTLQFDQNGTHPRLDLLGVLFLQILADCGGFIRSHGRGKKFVKQQQNQQRKYGRRLSIFAFPRYIQYNSNEYLNYVWPRAKPQSLAN